MGFEIERKFLVNHSALPDLGEGSAIRQGYITTSDPTIRVRKVAKKDHIRGELTLKGKGMKIRREYNVQIPMFVSTILMHLSPTRISKTRYRVVVGEHIWDVDKFNGALSGLWLAEIELKDPEEKFEMPPWVGDEVTEDPRYMNCALALAQKVPVNTPDPLPPIVVDPTPQ